MGCPLSRRPGAGSRCGTRPPATTGRRGPRCPGDTDVDVAVVGAGLTGLWTAYYLAEADPSLRIAVLEAEVAGFGASGRNGGWCSALFPASLAQARRPRPTGDGGPGPAPGDAGDRRRGRRGWPRPRASTPTSPRAARSALARSRAQWQRAPGRGARTPGPGAAARTTCGCSDAAEARRVLDGAGTLGATYTPDCAAIHPARLVRGLADGGRAARRADPRADPGHARSSPAGSGPPHGTVRAGRP